MTKLGIVTVLGDALPPLKTRDRFCFRKRSQTKFAEYVHKCYVFYHPPRTESSNHRLRAVDDVFGDHGQTLEKSGKLGIEDVHLAGTSHPF